MQEVEKGIWFINAENKGRFPYSHSLYIDTGDGGVLIDSGAGRELDRLAGRVQQVILSHYHRDHVARNGLFPEASFHIHSLDAPGVESPEGFARLSGIDRVYRNSFWDYVKQSGFRETEIKSYLTDKERFNLGSLTLQVIHAPGHTPGHCAFLIEEYEAVFAADIDLTSFGPWYGNISSDLELFCRSIRRIRELKPALFLSSHCNPVREEIERKLNDYEAVIEKRNENLCKMLSRSPLSLEQIVDRKPIFRRHPHPETIYRYFEENMIVKHLEVLERRGLVHCHRGEGNLFEAI